MTKGISATKPVTEFIDVAKKYCLLIEKRSEKTAIQLLQEAFILLPQLCLYGMRLPDVKRLSDYERQSRTKEQWNNVYKSLRNKLKDYDVYVNVFDPYDKKDHEAINNSVSYDLTDIYYDLKPGLKYWLKVSAADKLRIIWHWKWGFENHWGRHATQVFSALFSLLFEHIEGKDGFLIGIREGS